MNEWHVIQENCRRNTKRIKVSVLKNVLLSETPHVGWSRQLMLLQNLHKGSKNEIRWDMRLNTAIIWYDDKVLHFYDTIQLKSIYLYKKSPMMISFNKGKSYLNLTAPMWKSNWLLYLKPGCATLISKTCKSSICDHFQWVIHVTVEEFCAEVFWTWMACANSCRSNIWPSRSKNHKTGGFYKPGFWNLTRVYKKCVYL